MKYRSKVVWCLCLLLAGLGIVAVVPRVAHAATICNACKGTGKDICKFCGGRGCAQCNWKGGEYICFAGICAYGKCKYCDGTGKIYTPAEKAAMKKAADAEKAKQAAATNAERVRIEKAVGTFTDSRDGKTYKKIAIGTQTWMAQNLNYDVPDDTTDVCYGYENRLDNCAKYGRLYNWATAMNGSPSSEANPSGVQGVCPSGWHLPSDAEWTALIDFAGGKGTAGKKLKSKSGWYRDGNGTNEFVFSAIPGGYGNSGGYFYYAGHKGYWWSATENNANDAWNRYMDYDYEGVLWNDERKSGLFSVRCVQD